MATLAQLITDRCAAIAEFKSDIYSHREQDIISLNNAKELLSHHQRIYGLPWILFA